MRVHLSLGMLAHVGVLEGEARVPSKLARLLEGVRLQRVPRPQNLAARLGLRSRDSWFRRSMGFGGHGDFGVGVRERERERESRETEEREREREREKR